METQNYPQNDYSKSTASNRPEKKFRAGAVTATIWRNETMKDGKAVTYPSISFERTYKDRAGNWQTTTSLRTTDLPKAALVLNKAYEYLNLQEVEA